MTGRRAPWAARCGTPPRGVLRFRQVLALGARALRCARGIGRLGVGNRFVGRGGVVKGRHREGWRRCAIVDAGWPARPSREEEWPSARRGAGGTFADASASPGVPREPRSEPAKAPRPAPVTVVCGRPRTELVRPIGGQAPAGSGLTPGAEQRPSRRVGSGLKRRRSMGAPECPRRERPRARRAPERARIASGLAHDRRRKRSHRSALRARRRPAAPARPLRPNARYAQTPATPARRARSPRRQLAAHPLRRASATRASLPPRAANSRAAKPRRAAQAPRCRPRRAAKPPAAGTLTPR